jgi:hypothetical protein
MTEVLLFYYYGAPRFLGRANNAVSCVGGGPTVAPSRRSILGWPPTILMARDGLGGADKPTWAGRSPRLLEGRVAAGRRCLCSGRGCVTEGAECCFGTGREVPVCPLRSTVVTAWSHGP